MEIAYYQFNYVHQSPLINTIFHRIQYRHLAQLATHTIPIGECDKKRLLFPGIFFPSIVFAFKFVVNLILACQCCYFFLALSLPSIQDYLLFNSFVICPSINNINDT